MTGTQTRIHLFGTTRVTRDGTPVDGKALEGVKPRQVLSILALEAGSPVPKDRLAELLWDGAPPRSYSGTLESYVCLVRRHLGLRGRDSGLATVLHGYVLDPEKLPVDLTDFHRLIGPGGAGRHGCDRERLAAVEAALELVTGELLASEAYSPWAEQERTRFAAAVVAATVDAAGCALRLQEGERALSLARAAVRHGGFDEAAWRVLINALDATGRGAEALRAYVRLTELLASELGTTPSPETTRCYLDVLARNDDRSPRGSAGEELHLLLRLVRDRMHSVPGVDLPTADRGLGQLVAAIPSLG
ncbi:hypothetical protein GCM10009623_35460 [Nocardioides aestuarii]|uniref:Bacterial transcriptional activator domain-containing protein n=1 Tax=Nocardioides aestuarii TaxID=252231 RepID=A0ABW4TT37_9ACTN